MINLVTNSPEETREIGAKIGKLLQPGDVVALIGDLGSGKTCLTQGIAKGVGIDDNQYVISPSYIIVNEYAAPHPIYHLDLYRIRSAFELLDLGLDEYLYGRGICIIEWADRLLDELPESYLKVELFYVDENTRKMDISSVGTKYGALIKELTEYIDKSNKMCSGDSPSSPMGK